MYLFNACEGPCLGKKNKKKKKKKKKTNSILFCKSETNRYYKNIQKENKEKKREREKKKKKETAERIFINVCVQSQQNHEKWNWIQLPILIVLRFNDTSTLVGHFVSSPRERDKRDRRDSRRDERDKQGRKRNRNESEETEEIKFIPALSLPATRIASIVQL